MLMMSRSTDEEIVFPRLGVKITLHRNRPDAQAADLSGITKTPKSADCNSITPRAKGPDGGQIKTALNAVNLFAMLYRQQLGTNDRIAADQTFMKLVNFLERQHKNGRLQFTASCVGPSRVNGNIMIIDDDDARRDLLTEFLANNGLRVSAYTNGRSALQELRNNERPGLILLNGAMPEYGGPWLVPKLRNEFAEMAPRLFVLNGSPASVAASSYRRNVDAWLDTPLHREALMARIRTVYPAV